MLRLVLSGFFLFFLGLSSARAEGGVQVRACRHDGYSRLVFQWNKNVPYTLTTDAAARDDILALQDYFLCPGGRVVSGYGVFDPEF
jgi:hypothetical protein